MVEGPELARRQKILGPTQADPASGEDVLGLPVEKLLGSVGRGREGAAVAKRSQEVLRPLPGQWARAFSSHTSRDRIGKV